MLAEEEARARILQNVQPLPPRNVALADAVDCFAAKDYSAVIPLPVFDNSAMDGYAVIATDCRPGARLRIIGEQPAGLNRQLRVSSSETIRIFTGAPMPAGADAVVMQEDVERDGTEIILNVDVDAGEFVRRHGCDLSEGQKILAAGSRIRSTILALLAAQGFPEVKVGGEVGVAIISTGDELAKPGAKLQPGQIYESNSTLLQALVQGCGAIVGAVEYCGDDSDSLHQTLREAMKYPVLIVTGGVSVGEHDLVQSALRSLGAKIGIWRVAIKPGKPFLFGQIGPSPQSSPYQGEADATAPGEGRARDRDCCFIFGLPGNPVSAFVTFLQFVRPAILKMMGASDHELELRRIPAQLVVDLKNDSDRVHYIRGKLEEGKFTPVGRQESHALFGLSQANALVRLVAGGSMNRNAIVDVQVWD